MKMEIAYTDVNFYLSYFIFLEKLGTVRRSLRSPRGTADPGQMSKIHGVMVRYFQHIKFHRSRADNRYIGNPDTVFSICEILLKCAKYHI